ncbi:hypothetical protein DQ354_07510 [Arthrobacter sp. AQ5-06]|nr:hypothetical protein DQ354_07510 [Arthrobacter sp. AQ5-06]
MASGELAPGQKCPPEGALSQQLGVREAATAAAAHVAQAVFWLKKLRPGPRLDL